MKAARINLFCTFCQISWALAIVTFPHVLCSFGRTRKFLNATMSESSYFFQFQTYVEVLLQNRCTYHQDEQKAKPLESTKLDEVRDGKLVVFKLLKMVILSVFACLSTSRFDTLTNFCLATKVMTSLFEQNSTSTSKRKINEMTARKIGSRKWHGIY